MNKVWKRRESRVLSIRMMLVMLLQYKQRYYRSKQNLLATDFSSSLIDSSCWSLLIRLCGCTTKPSINALVKPAVSTYSVPQIRATCYDHVMLSIMDKQDISVNIRKPSRSKSSQVVTNIKYTWCNQDTIRICFRPAAAITPMVLHQPAETAESILEHNGCQVSWSNRMLTTLADSKSRHGSIKHLSMIVKDNICDDRPCFSALNRLH